MSANYSKIAVIGAIALTDSISLPAFSIAAETAVHVEYIGTATMNNDGTIVLHLVRTADGTPAEGFFTYSPGDPQYEVLLHHLGGLSPRESKLI
jgi:hypothetical protein